MTVWSGETYWLVRFLFQRLLGVTYLLAFLAAAFQFRALAGVDGILPLSQYRERWAFRERPSLFHLVPSDRAIAVAGWTGVGLAVLATTGVSELFGTPVSMVVWASLWLLYLSFVNAGQTFYGFGWESMLLETGFLAIFLGAGDVAAPAVVIWLLRWVLFRNMLGAGLIKIRGDPCWRDLTCLTDHYETQPMPNPLSWRVHHLPEWFHRAGVLINHVVELAIPFLYFAPQPIAAIAGAITIGFQAWLMVSGNFSWLNFLTIVLAVSTFSDGVLAAVSPVALGGPAVAATPLWLTVLVWILALGVLALSIRPTLNLLSPEQAMNTAFDPLHLVNTYGAFGSITTTRYELVVQGTADAVVDEDTEWETYQFKGKPTDPERRPPQVAPYHLRLDWQLWFAAMSPVRRNPWFVELCGKLLEGDDRVRRLLYHDPFPDDSPEHVRALRYRYEFTDPDERAETRTFWRRERVETYFGPVSLSDARFDIVRIDREAS